MNWSNLERIDGLEEYVYSINSEWVCISRHKDMSLLSVSFKLKRTFLQTKIALTAVYAFIRY